MNILSLIKTYRKGLFFIAFLILIENIAWIIEPTLFGNLIDALIEKASGRNFTLQLQNYLPLFLWIGVYIINSSSGTLRRMYEPRVFQRMYVNIVTYISEMSILNKLDVGQSTARANLSQEYITFMQYRAPEIVEQIISISGAVIALSFFDYRISLVCFFISVPLIILTNVYSKKVLVLQKELHDNYENIYDTFASKNTHNVKSLFSSNAKLQSKIAFWGSFNFGILRLVLLFIFLIVLFVAIDLDDFSTGNIYSIVAYLWTFVTSVEYIPELLESKTSLQDLTRRIKSDS